MVSLKGVTTLLPKCFNNCTHFETSTHVKFFLAGLDTKIGRLINFCTHIFISDKSFLMHDNKVII